MGSCWSVFVAEWQKIKKPIGWRNKSSSYRGARYRDRESIEFQNLIEDEDFYDNPRYVITDEESSLLNDGRYDDLAKKQSTVDAEIDEQLRKHEEDLRLEEEAYYQAKREAAKVAQQSKQLGDKEKSSKENDLDKFDALFDDTAWITDDTLNHDGGEMDTEDFETFLERVKARSLNNATGKSTAYALYDEGKPGANWEDTLAKSVEATKIADRSLNALQAALNSPDSDSQDSAER